MLKVFDFKCGNCSIVVEKLVKADSKVFCEKCPETEMTRCISAPGMVKTNFADKTGFKAR